MKFSYFTCITGLSVGLGMAAMVLSAHLESDNHIQAGFAKTSKLEITLEDRDNNGMKETVLRYDGKPYLLKEVDGKPAIRPYNVEVSTK